MTTGVVAARIRVGAFYRVGVTFGRKGGLAVLTTKIVFVTIPLGMKRRIF
jgi:hypothetical protein